MASRKRVRVIVSNLPLDTFIVALYSIVRVYRVSDYHWIVTLKLTPRSTSDDRCSSAFVAVGEEVFSSLVG
jgi:hypothetical protein